MKDFKHELYELLTLQAPSGKEERVRNYLYPKLEVLCDDLVVDAYGNLLAVKSVGDGNGATVVLSAHMDTVNDVRKGRKVLFDQKTQRFTSSKGILGADDRAGIAIILAVLRNIEKSGFNGTIKVCFSREEEIGCIGADHIPVGFYDDADLAIVVDRKGSRDIVTGCGMMYGFCSPEVGAFFEDVSRILDMDWKAVPGGVSDAYIFSGNGVHSVNLSAGYMHEHTANEYVDTNHSRDTINFILQAFAVINSQRHKFGEIPQQATYSYANGGLPTNWEDESEIAELQEEYSRGDAVFYDKYDSFGSVSATALMGFISLYQDGSDGDGREIFMDEKNFRLMIDQYCLVTGYQAGVQTRNDREMKRMENQVRSYVKINDGFVKLSANGELVQT